MEAVRKKDIKKNIADFHIKIEIEDMLRSMVNKFKHYKQVNKRFIDAINELGDEYHAWMIKDRKHYIAVTKKTGNYERVQVELYVYGEELTWDTILKELDRCSFREQLLREKQKLAQFETDIETMRKILTYIEIEGCDVKNFSLYSLKSNIERAIKHSGE